jgi:hypothetical protein
LPFAAIITANLSVLHHEKYTSQHGDVFERIIRHRDDIGYLADLQRAEIA